MFLKCRENPCHINKYSYNFQKIYREYVATLRREKLFDYPKLIRRANAILQKNIVSIDKKFKSYQYIFVDEIQDSSQSRFKLLRLLTGNDTFLFMVGDSDQQILEWAGVKNNNLKRLKRYYPDFEIYTLEKSYRLTKEICEVANNLICHNKNRINKILKPINGSKGYFRIKQFNCYEDETTWCLKKINRLLDKGVNQRDIAVLVRKEKMLSTQLKATGVYCSTIHKSKGAEFKYFFIIGVERGIFTGNMEEERRLLFVGITRAKKSCVLTYISNGMRKDGYLDRQVCKSEFIDELYT